jgi:ABC-type multidrug transport system fused ATPase/permease subunit
MFAFGVSEVVQASVVTAIGGILITLITQFTRSNAKDHALVQNKLDQLSDKIVDTHTSVTEVKVDVKYLREDQNRLENRFNTHLEDRNEKSDR